MSSSSRENASISNYYSAVGLLKTGRFRAGCSILHPSKASAIALHPFLHHHKRSCCAQCRIIQVVFKSLFSVSPDWNWYFWDGTGAHALCGVRLMEKLVPHCEKFTWMPPRIKQQLGKWREITRTETDDSKCLADGKKLYMNSSTAYQFFFSRVICIMVMKL